MYIVEKILDHRPGNRKNHVEFLVRWEGHETVNDSWEAEAYIHDPTRVQGYWDYVASRDKHIDQQAKRIRKSLCLSCTLYTALTNVGMILARTCLIAAHAANNFASSGICNASFVLC